jgi:hypothetical protein
MTFITGLIPIDRFLLSSTRQRIAAGCRIRRVSLAIQMSDHVRHSREPGIGRAVRHAWIARCAASGITVAIILLFGCEAVISGDSNARGTTMAASEQSGRTERIQWALGPLSGTDAPHNIVLRSSQGKGQPPSKRRPKSLVTRPMIQGAPEAICVGDDGSQFVGGSFSGTRDFNTGPGRDIHQAVGIEDGFLSRFDRSGKYCWTVTFGASERINVRGIAASHDAVYAVCGEQNGYIGILAIDPVTGAPKSRFGSSGCQMFHSGRLSFASAIGCLGRSVFVTVNCVNAATPTPERSSPAVVAFPVAAVLAIDGADGSALQGFGTRGIQIVGGASSPAERFRVRGLATTPKTIYVVGSCYGPKPGATGVISITGEFSEHPFIAALDVTNGKISTTFGNNGFVVMRDSAKTAADVVASESRLYLTGCWDEPSTTRAFVAALELTSGKLDASFGDSGIRVFGTCDWQCGHSIRVHAEVVYVAGAYIARDAEGIFLEAFNKVNGKSLATFGNRGRLFIDGLEFGEQGQIGILDGALYLVARTDERGTAPPHEIKIGNLRIDRRQLSGFLFRFTDNGVPADK